MTPSKFDFLRKIDQVIFDKVDEFKKTNAYVQIFETYATLDDEKQKISKLILLGLTVLIPFLFVFFFWLNTQKISQDLNARIKLVEVMQDLINQNNEVGGLAGTMGSSSPIESQDALSQRLASILNASGFNVSKIAINNFISQNISESLVKSEADFKFTDITTDEMVTLFLNMIQNERFKVSSVEITRSNSDNKISGIFHAIHFGQILSNEVEE
jgi:hypothetical protein